MKKYYDRLIEPYLETLMQEFPAIAVDGLKGVGKTVSSKRLASTVFELDRPRDYDQIANTPDILVSEEAPILIDEWQRIPSVWDHVRRAVDNGAKPGTFLLTGSIANTDTNIHSGAGRIIRRRMYAARSCSYRDMGHSLLDSLAICLCLVKSVDFIVSPVISPLAH